MSASTKFYLWIAIGSGLGGAARFGCAEIAAHLLGDAFPWGILFVNVAGSFVLGFFFAYTGPDGRLPVSSTTRQFVMPGLCGGFTTFSAFSLDTLNLVRDGDMPVACANVVLSIGLCLVLVWLGHALAVRLNPPKRALQV